MIFAISLKMVISKMVTFIKNFENHIQGEFVKILKCTLVIIFVIFPQKWQFRLKNLVLKFLGLFSLCIFIVPCNFISVIHQRKHQ